MRLTMFGMFHWLFIKPYTFYWVGAAIAVGGAVAGALGGRSARRKARRQRAALTKLNNEMIDMETAENIRKLDKTHDQVQGAGKALMGSSGIAREGTSQLYLDDIEKQFQGEKSWMEKSAEMRKKQNLMGASHSNAASSDQGRADNISSITSIAGFFS